MRLCELFYNFYVPVKIKEFELSENYNQSFARAKAVTIIGKGSQNASGRNIVITTVAARLKRNIIQYLPFDLFWVFVDSVI